MAFLSVLKKREKGKGKGKGSYIKKKAGVMGDVDDAILKSFLAEVGEVERDNEVVRFPFPKTPFLIPNYPPPDLTHV